MKRLALVVVMLSVVGVVGCGKDKVTNPPVATRRTVTVDAVGRVGEWTSLALDGQGNPCISYQDAGNGDLMYASWGVH